MEDRICLVKINDPFTRKDREESVIPYNGESLLALRQLHFPIDVDVQIIVNGRIISEEEWPLITLKNGYQAIFVPKVGDGDVFRSIAFIALAVTVAWVAPELAGYVGAAVWDTAATAGMAVTAYTATYAAVALGGLYLGGALINALLPISAGQLNDVAMSQINSWSPVTTQKQGIVIPQAYGKNKVFGNIIGAYSEVIDDKNYLNLLLGFCRGPVAGFTNFQINGQDASLYDGVTIETRQGFVRQPIITNFNDTKTEYVVGGSGRKVKYGNPAVYRTQGNAFDGLEVVLKFPRGLYHANTSGGLDDHEIDVKVTATCVSDPTKIYVLTGSDVSDVGTQTLNVSRWSLGFYVMGAKHWFEIQSGSTVETDHLEGQIEQGTYTQKTIDTTTGLETDSTVTMTGMWRWIVAGQTISGTSTNDYSKVIEHKNEEFTKTFVLREPTDLWTKGYYDITVTRINEDYSSIQYADDMWFYAVREVMNDDFTYPRTAIAGIKALSTDQLSGSFTFSCDMLCKYIRVYQPDEVTGTDGKNYRCKVSHTASVSNKPISGANWATYWEQKGHVAVLNSVAWAEGVSYSATPSWRIVYSDNPAWVCYDVLTQPSIYDGWLANENLLSYCSGRIIRPTVLNGYLYECAWGGTTGATEPTWPTTIGATVVDGTVVWRCITGAATDGIIRFEGFDPARLITSDFQSWADFCDTLVDDGAGSLERRLTFNGVFDSDSTLWEAALQICSSNRAVLVWYGYRLAVVVDQSASYTQMFSMGNVISGSLEESFLSLEDRAGEVEIGFRNVNKDYERDAVSLFNTGLNNPTNKSSLYLIGITKESEAWRAAKYVLLGNQYWTRTIRFGADIDSIICTIGDVIAFQHDVPRWGLGGGRIVSATSSSVTIDQTVTIESDKTYGLMIRLSNDTLVTKVITNSPGDYTVLNVSVPFSTIPSQYDPYSFGESGSETKLFRVSNISRTGEHAATIEAVEYNELVYTGVDSGTPVLASVSYTSGSSIGVVTSLAAVENASMDESGNIVRTITLSFKKPNNPLYKRALVYYKKSDTGTYLFLGQTDSERFIFIGAEPSITYTFRVVSESWSGVRTTNNLSPTVTITTKGIGDWVGSQTLQDTVTGLHIDGLFNSTEFTGRDCKLVWNEITAVDLDFTSGEEACGAGTAYPPQWFKDYEIKIYDELDNLRRTEYTSNPYYVYSYEKNYEDEIVRTFKVEVRARDRYYRKSATPASITVTNPAPDAPSNILITSMALSAHIAYDANDEPDFQGYLIYASKDSAFTPDTDTLKYQGKETHPLIVLASGIWFIKVAAYDTFGTTGLNYATQQSIQIYSTDPLDRVPPAVPVNLELTTGNEQNAQADTSYIEATWNENTEDDFGNYVLQIRKDGETRYTEVFSKENKYKFIGLVPGVTYWVKIKAVDIWGNESEFSSEISSSAHADTAAPATPTGFAVSAGLKKIICSWDINTEADLAGYEVSIKPNGGAYSVFYKGLSTVVVYDGSPAIKYYAKVRAYDWSGNYSDYCVESSATTAQVATADVQTGAITSDKVTTGQLITLSAQIGDALITDGKIVSLSANKIATGTLAATSEISVGETKIKISGTNSNILINDGTRDRVKLGKLGTGLYGLQIYDSDGNEVMSTAGKIIRVEGLYVTGTLTGNTIQTSSTGKRFVVSSTDNEALFYGDRGDGTVEELCAIGLNNDIDDYAVLKIGGANLDRYAAAMEGKDTTVLYVKSDRVGSLGQAIYCTASGQYQNGVTAYITGASAYAIYGEAYNATSFGVLAKNSNGGSALEAWGATYDIECVHGGSKGPISLGASSSADAPTHSANKGTLWVTSAGILYINTDGSTTWAKVGGQ